MIFFCVCYFQIAERSSIRAPDSTLFTSHASSAWTASASTGKYQRTWNYVKMSPPHWKHSHYPKVKTSLKSVGRTNCNFYCNNPVFSKQIMKCNPCVRVQKAQKSVFCSCWVQFPHDQCTSFDLFLANIIQVNREVNYLWTTRSFCYSQTLFSCSRMKFEAYVSTVQM